MNKKIVSNKKVLAYAKTFLFETIQNYCLYNIPLCFDI